MAWPTDTLTKIHLDQTSDDPSLARAEIEDCVDMVKLILANVNAGSTIWNSGNLPKSGSGLKLDNFGAATLMLFQLTTAPTGWLKQTTHNNKALRVVSGTASSGGSVAFTTAMANRTVSTKTGHTHTMAHTHTSGTLGGSVTGGGFGGGLTGGSHAVDVNSGSTGGSSAASTGANASHNHTLDMRVQYVDLIIAAKA